MNLSEIFESKRSELESLLTLAKTEERELNVEEQASFDALTIEVRDLKEKIDLAETERQAKEVADAEAKRESDEKLVLEQEAARSLEIEVERSNELIRLNADLEAEREAKIAAELKLVELERSIEQKNENKMELFDSIRGLGEGVSGTFKVAERAAVDGDTTAIANVIPKGVNGLDILGKEPIWTLLGVDYMPNAKGTYILPFESPIVGAKLAELAPIVGDVVTPDGTLVSPKRFSVSKTFTSEAIATGTDDYFAKVMADMIKGCDRAISTEVFAKVVAGATTVAAVTSLTKGNFELLMAGAEIEDGGAFLSERAEFFAALDVPIDAGSGKFLAGFVNGSNGAKGVTNTGTPYWYSTLFTNATKVVAYGDMSRIHVADYNNIEVIIDKYTKASTGQVVITVNKLANVALLNPAAFTKSGVIV